MMNFLNFFKRNKKSAFKKYCGLCPIKRTGANIYKYGGLLAPGQYCSITKNHLLFYVGENVNNYLFEVSIFKQLSDPIEAPHGAIIEIKKTNFKKFRKNFIEY
jgi:hypothetical protein